VRPEVELGDYRSLRVEVPATEVTDEQVEEMIEELRRRNSELRDVERPAQAGDVLRCSLVMRRGDEVLSGEEEQETKPEREELLGLSIAPLTEELRNQYGIGRTVEGVVITEVKPDSPAAKKDVKPGDVIVEVTQEKVKQPQDVKARLLAVKKSGRRSVLLLLSDAKGELRFVAVPTS